MRNLITDVPGVQVGHAQDPRLASGTTVVLFDAPAVAGITSHRTVATSRVLDDGGRGSAGHRGLAGA